MKHATITILSCIIVSMISYNVGAASTVPASGVIYKNATVQSTLDNLMGKVNIGDATAGQILSGKKALVQGSLVTGTMTNRGAVSETLDAGKSYTIPAGYHNGSGKVTASSLADQTIATATASDIVSGKTAYVNGTKITGTKDGAISYILDSYPNRTVTISNNQKSTLYVLTTAYADNGVSTASERIKFSSCTGANYELVSELRNSSLKFATNIYKLTNATSTITITTTTTSSSSTIGGMIIVLG